MYVPFVPSPVKVAKRNLDSMLVPKSMYSYLMGALRTNFSQLKDNLFKNLAFVAAKEDSNSYAELLLEELFRYLFLLADNAPDETIWVSPSYFVEQAFGCLMHDPVLYYKICDEILTMRGKDRSEREIRVLPHDPLVGSESDSLPRKVRYNQTLVRYKEAFGQDPPLSLWTDYSDDVESMQADLEAQQAEEASQHSHTKGETGKMGHLSFSPGNATALVSPLVSPLTQPATSVEPAIQNEMPLFQPEPSPLAAAIEAEDNSPVLLTARNAAGRELQFKMPGDRRMGVMMNAYAEQEERSVDDFRFTFNGLVVFPTDTPRSLRMADGDRIIVSQTSNHV